jgi:hypothetical protein
MGCKGVIQLSHIITCALLDVTRMLAIVDG